MHLSQRLESNFTKSFKKYNILKPWFIFLWTTFVLVFVYYLVRLNYHLEVKPWFTYLHKKCIAPNTMLALESLLKDTYQDNSLLNWNHL